ncbi:MAG: hypothetical protein M3144_08145, partial [Actinomycetota bacterium]|nr:hypothetical protein [Actinomycetota bacterium]
GEAEAEEEEAGEAEAGEGEDERAGPPDRDGEESGVDVDVEPGAAPLVDAMLALEHAARVEAELSQAGPALVETAGGVDLKQLTERLRRIEMQQAALHALVDSLGVEIRERLDILHEEILVGQGRLGPPTAPPAMRAADQVTRVLPAVPDEAEPTETEAGAETSEGVAKKAGRRVLLLVLLVLLGLVIAGGIVAIGVFGWDQVRSQFSLLGGV